MSRLWTDDGRTECEDRARILETEFAIKVNTTTQANTILPSWLWSILHNMEKESRILGY